MGNMIRLSARSRSLLKHAGDFFSLKVALGACYLADTSGKKKLYFFIIHIYILQIYLQLCYRYKMK